MRSLSLHVIHIISGRGPTDTVGAKILMMDQRPRAMWPDAESIEWASHTVMDMGIFARPTITAESRHQVHAMAYARR